MIIRRSDRHPKAHLDDITTYLIDNNATYTKIEEHSGRCLSAAVVNNHYNVIETKKSESQQSWMWSTVSKVICKKYLL